MVHRDQTSASCQSSLCRYVLLLTIVTVILLSSLASYVVCSVSSGLYFVNTFGNYCSGGANYMYMSSCVYVTDFRFLLENMLPWLTSSSVSFGFINRLNCLCSSELFYQAGWWCNTLFSFVEMSDVDKACCRRSSFGTSNYSGCNGIHHEGPH